MIEKDHIEFITKLLDFAHLFMLTLIASAARYANSVLGGAKFRLSRFIGFLTVSFFASFLAGEFIPLGIAGRDGLIGLAAFSGISAIEYFELKFYKLKTGTDAHKEADSDHTQDH